MIAPAPSPVVVRHGASDAYRARVRVELTQFWRMREAVFFTLAFPVVMVLLFGAIFRNATIGEADHQVPFTQYFVAGMIGAGVWGAAFQNLAVGVAVERDTGGLKRLIATPMPRSAYFVGKIVMVLLLTVVETALVLVIGGLFFGVRIPPSSRWPTFVEFVVLGVAACALFGLGVAGLIPTGRSASVVVTPFAVVLQFISGVYLVFGDLPGWMQTIGNAFPLAWLTRGMRAVLLPASFHLVEPGHTWALGAGAAVLGAWCVVGLAVTVRTFRWVPRSAGR